MGSGFSKMKKQARQLEEQYQKMKDTLKLKEFEGSSGSGLVQVTMNGEMEVTKLLIKSECMDKEDPEALQDLILAALKTAHQKAQKESSSMDDLPFSF